MNIIRFNNQDFAPLRCLRLLMHVVANVCATVDLSLSEESSQPHSYGYLIWLGETIKLKIFLKSSIVGS